MIKATWGGFAEDARPGRLSDACIYAKVIAAYPPRVEVGAAGQRQENFAMGIRERLRGKWQAAGTLSLCMRHFANWREVWAAYRAGRTVPPLTLRSGLKLHHGEGDAPVFLYRELFVEHCPLSDDFYRPGPGDVVADIGANIGFFALLLQERAPGIRVHCFEPSLATCEVIRRSVEANGLEGSIAVHQCAVSDRRAVLQLKHGGSSLSHSFFIDGDPSQTESVESIGLDEALDLCGEGPIDLLKIDVEGAEIEIVEGASPRTWERVRRMVVEFHDMIRPGCRERP